MVTSLTLGDRAKPDGFFEGDGIWWAVAFGVGGVLILCGNDGDNLVLCLPPVQCRHGITQCQWV